MEPNAAKIGDLVQISERSGLSLIHGLIGPIRDTDPTAALVGHAAWVPWRHLDPFVPPAPSPAWEPEPPAPLPFGTRVKRKSDGKPGLIVSGPHSPNGAYSVAWEGATAMLGSFLSDVDFTTPDRPEPPRAAFSFGDLVVYRSEGDSLSGQTGRVVACDDRLNARPYLVAFPKQWGKPRHVVYAAPDQLSLVTTKQKEKS